MATLVDSTIKTRLLLRPLRSPLGTIRLGGVNQGGIGVGQAGPRTLSFYSLVVILNGVGVYADARTGPTPVKPGDLVVFFPGRPHRCRTQPGEFWDEIWFDFEGPVFDLMRATGLLDPRRPVHSTQNPDHWFKRFFQLVPPLHLREKTPPAAIVSRFATILTEILAGGEAAAEPAAPPDDWVGTACELLAAHPGSVGLDPERVAQQLGFSYETFRKRFKQATGSAPGRYQLDSRIDRAAALLHQGRQNIKEIADELRFCDEFYFSRCFKRRFGQSPRAFRRRIRG